MIVEELFESGYQGQPTRPAMISSNLAKVEDILYKYAAGYLTSQKARKQMRELGYDIHPDMRSGWRANKAQIKDIRTERLYWVEI